ncbi:MAG: hypothetical protein K6V36_04465 [Anaerolineae bacterium]|nr:hypothetical protein [Anaerolineae bacterium]
MSLAPAAVTVATLSVDIPSLQDQLNELAELAQIAADTYASRAGSLPEPWMTARAEEFQAGALRARDAAVELMHMVGGRPSGQARGLATAFARARASAEANRDDRLTRLQSLQDMLIAAFLTAAGWAMVQSMAYGIGDPRLIEVAERQVAETSLPYQWLLAATTQYSSWAILQPQAPG